MGRTGKLFRAIGSAFDIKDTIMLVRAGISALSSGSLTGGLLGALTEMPTYSIILISLGAGLLILLFAPQIIKRIWVSPPDVMLENPREQQADNVGGDVTQVIYYEVNHFHINTGPPVEEKEKEDE